MKQVGVLVALLCTIAVCLGKDHPNPIDTKTNPVGQVPFNFTDVETNDTITFEFDFSGEASDLYLVLNAMVIPDGASLTFNQPAGDDKTTEILKVEHDVGDAMVVYSNTDKSTVVLAVGPNYKYEDVIPIVLSYTVQDCEVSVGSNLLGAFTTPYAVNGTGTLKCTYTLRPLAKGFARGVTFPSFNLPSGSLTLSGSQSKNASHKAGDTHAGDYVAETITLVLEGLKTDSITPTNTFTAHYTTYGNECSAMMSVGAGKTVTVQSPGYPNDYPGGQNCLHVLEAPAGMRLALTVHEAKLADIYDFIVVLDGDNKAGPPIMVLAPGDEPTSDQIFLSSTETLWVNLVTDFFGAAAGFNFTITPIPYGARYYESGDLELKKKAEETLAADAEATDVYFTLFAHAGEQVIVDISNFSVIPSDSIEFYDGISAADPLLARFTSNSNLHQVYSTGKELMIVARGFLVNGSLHDDWFIGKFKSAPVSPLKQISVGVEGSYGLTAEDKYPAEAVWLIQNPNKDTDVVELSLDIINLANSDNVTSNVTVYRGLSDADVVLAHFIPDTQTTNLPKFYVQDGVRITYTSQGGDAKPKDPLLLQASYRITQGCKGSLTPGPKVNTLVMSSPNFPDRYPYNADCKWNYTIPTNKTVQMSFVNFDLAQEHFVSVSAEVEKGDERLGNGTKNETTVSYGKYEGQSVPDDVIVSGEKLQVEFSSITDGTDNFTVGQGVLANLRLLDCGGNLTASTGDFESPTTTDQALCVWIINVPKAGKENGSVNTIEFDLYIKRVKNETFRLTLKDGASMYAEDMSVELRNGEQKARQSRYNQMYVEFEKPAGELGEDRFQIKYNIYECPSSQQCKNGVCMQKGWKCNGVDNCGDASDEIGCTTSNGKEYGKAALGIMFICSLAFGIFLAFLIPPCYRKIRSRCTGETSAYGNLQEEPVV